MLTYYNRLCGYNVPNLRPQVFLFGSLHSKEIDIDVSGEAYVHDFDGTPYILDCMSVEYNEQSSLDERYLFDKTVTFKVKGYGGYELVADRRYIVIQTVSGEYRLVTVDYPAEMSYEFTLNENEYSTTYTFHALSNFPTLRLDANFNNAERVCAYHTTGIDKLGLNYKQSAVLDREAGKITTNADRFLNVEFLKATLTESFSDATNECVDTLTFTLPITAHKSSWHYNVEEFQMNKYCAKVGVRQSTQTLFVGFNDGLCPEYSVEDATGNAGVRTVSMRERSNLGLCSLYTYTEEVKANMRYENVSSVGNIMSYECNGNGTAIYLLKREMDGLGNPTGNYLAYSGWTGYFEEQGLTITGEFSDEAEFSNPTCISTDCKLTTTVPPLIEFYGSGTTAGYTIKSDCAWTIEDLPSGITSSVSSGTINYNVTFSSNLTSDFSGHFKITNGYYTQLVNVRVYGNQFITPTAVTTDCTSKTLTFQNIGGCRIDVTASEGLVITYSMDFSTFTATIPANETTSNKNHIISVTNLCDWQQQNIVITQTKRYEEWRQINDEYVCEQGAKYRLLTLFTGTTSSNLVQTSEKRRGSAYEGSLDCENIITRYVWNGEYQCEGNIKYRLLEGEDSWDGGLTWTPNGQFMLGESVGEDATYCGNATYTWVLSNETACEDNVTPTPPTNYKVTVYDASGNTTGYDGTETAVTRSVVTGLTMPLSAITSVVISTGMTAIDANAFSGCTALTNVVMQNSITSIGDKAFYHCSSLTGLTIPTSVITIGSNVFNGCTSLSSMTIPSSVTSVGEAMYYGCSSLQTLQLSSYINAIPESFCENCPNLTAITIPFAVQTIGNWAFNQSTRLQVFMENYMPCTLDLGASQDYNHFVLGVTISVPYNSGYRYATATGWSTWSSGIVERSTP